MKEVRVRISKIEYLIEDEDIPFGETAESVRGGLPSEVDVTIDVEDPSDDDEVRNAVEEALAVETAWLLSSYEYSVINQQAQ